MQVVQILIMGILFFPLPALAGMVLGRRNQTKEPFVFSWICGQVFLWAGFLLISVPLILAGRKFTYVVRYFSLYSIILAAAGCARYLRGKRKAGECALSHPKQKDKRQKKTEKNNAAILLWIVFGALLAFQLIQALRLTYADWDDAFYVATSTITTDADTMYQKLPYTGGETTLEARHGLAPFPIWIAYLARISGMRTVVTAHMAVPVLLISMSYAIFYLLAGRLFPEKTDSRALFLIFTEILVLFGNYSIYSVENFMLARSRQGKAALGSIIVPLLVYLLLTLWEQIQDKRKIDPGYWALLTATLLAGCLCSTMGAMLGCLFVGTAGLCGAVAYRRWRVLFALAASCIPSLCLIGMYMLLQ